MNEPTLQLYQNIRELLLDSRRKTYRAINSAMVATYWNIGRMIVEDEQNGQARAEYGKQLLAFLAKKLTAEFGEGFNERSLRFMRAVFQAFPIWNALRSELTWTHYRLLAKVGSENARLFYLDEAASGLWSSRQLERQINSFFYERLLKSPEKQAFLTENAEKAQKLTPKDIIKDPYVLEFLALERLAKAPKERALENALIDKLQLFLLELGKGFAFVARQKRVATESKQFFIDLVFYNILLKCYVLIDLKTTELGHADIGQMDMYVRIFEDQMRGADDNPTIGLIFCAEKDETIVRYSVLHENEQIFASKYKLHLPTEAELAAEMSRELHQIKLEKSFSTTMI